MNLFAPPAPTMQARTSLDVIVAEDEPSDRLLLAMAATDADLDLSFTFAEDGEDLLSILMQRLDVGLPPDVIVLDIRMPRCNGLEAMEIISSHEALRAIPVVMFTTSRRLADMERGLSLGVVRYEVKPRSYPELVAFARELAEVARA
jgi:two-component system response regulator